MGLNALEVSIVASVTIMAGAGAVAAVLPMVPAIRRCVTRLWRGLGRAATSAVAMVRGGGDAAVLRPPAFFEMAAGPTAAVAGEGEKLELVLPAYQQSYATEKRQENEGEKKKDVDCDAAVGEEQKADSSSGGLEYEEDITGSGGGDGLSCLDMNLEDNELGSSPTDSVPAGRWTDCWEREGRLERTSDRTYTIVSESEEEVENAEVWSQDGDEEEDDAFDASSPVRARSPQEDQQRGGHGDGGEGPEKEKVSFILC